MTHSEMGGRSADYCETFADSLPPEKVPIRASGYIALVLEFWSMWLEVIVDGEIVTFSDVGMNLNAQGRDPRCEWAGRVEREARRICGRTRGIIFRSDKGDLTVNLHSDAVGPVVRAITELEPSMSQDVRGFFQRICYLLENGERVRLFENSRLR